MFSARLHVASTHPTCCCGAPQVMALLEQTLVEVVEEPQDGLLLEMGLVVAVDLE